MSEEEQRKIEKEVLNFIALAFKTESIDILALDAKTLDMIIRGFQLGVEFTEKKRKEIEESAMKEIPF